MKGSNKEIIIFLIVGFILFFAGWRAGKEEGYNLGFKDGAIAAEEYAKDCYNDLDNEIEDKYGITAFDASLTINKYDGEDSGNLLFSKYTDVVNSHSALESFYELIWDKLCVISDVVIDVAEISAD